MPRTLTPKQAREMAAQRKEKRGGRPRIPTPCPKCGAPCPSVNHSRVHC